MNSRPVWPIFMKLRMWFSMIYQIFYKEFFKPKNHFYYFNLKMEKSVSSNLTLLDINILNFDNKIE